MPTPIQPNVVEQAGQLIDFIDKVNGRRANSTPEPNQSGLNFNAAQFQSNPAMLQMQELLLRNPELISQVQALRNQQQSPVQNQQAQSAEQLQRENAKLKYVQHYQNQYSQAASHHAQVAGLSHIATVGLTEQLNHAVNMALTGGIAIELLAPMIEETYALKQHVSVLEKMLSDPYFLIYHCFENWFATITADNIGFMDLLSEAYMRFVESFENSRRQKFGQYTEQYTEYLNKKANELPPEIIQRQEQSANQYRDFARAIQSPGFGTAMQRQHSIMRQTAGIR